jgi:hypothetical protein
MVPRRPREAFRPRLALAVLSVTTFLSVFDGLVVNLALPAMQVGALAVLAAAPRHPARRGIAA